MDKQVRVWDDHIDESLHKEVYDWGQSVSWYAKALLDINGDYIKGVPNDRDFDGWAIQEYRPSLHGNGNPRPDTPEKFEAELTEVLKRAVELEIKYAQDVLPRGILGLNSEMFVEYMQFIANRRLENLNMKYRYDSDNNPFPWLSEVIDIRKQKNFFETRVIDYQDESALVDDF